MGETETKGSGPLWGSVAGSQVPSAGGRFRREESERTFWRIEQLSQSLTDNVAHDYGSNLKKQTRQNKKNTFSAFTWAWPGLSSGAVNAAPPSCRAQGHTGELFYRVREASPLTQVAWQEQEGWRACGGRGLFAQRTFPETPPQQGRPANLRRAVGTAERGGGGADLRETPTSRGTGLLQGVEPSKAHGAGVLRGLLRGVSALLWAWAKFSKQNWKGGAEPT